MECGFYELDITPTLGSIIPGDFAARYADEVLDPLFVRAFAAKTETGGLALVVIDACGITLDITERVRERVKKSLPLSDSQIMVMATHTHGGGPTLNWGEEVVTDSSYLDFLVKRAADAVISAWENAEESELLKGSEKLDGVSFIRIYKMKDGSLKTNPASETADEIDEPYTTIDPEVLVLAAKVGDRFKGALINFATHPATIVTNQITGDYISILSKEMKKIYGEQFVSVFINGACGNINHLNPFDKETYKREERYRLVGKRIAEKASGAISKAEPMTEDKLFAASEVIDVRLRKPTAEYLLWAKGIFDSLGDDLINSTPKNPNYLNTFFALQAFRLQADKNTVRKINLQVFKIGDCAIFGTPCQMFAEYGKKIKAACGKFSFISCFANDYCGYVPVPECMKEGVYEARLASTSCLEPAAGDKVCDAVIKMYRSMN